MINQKSEPKPEDKIDFHFETYAELQQVFGKRAANLLRAKQRKAGPANGDLPQLTAQDIEIALKFLAGEKTGAQTSRVLRAFKLYFASKEQRRQACEAFLKEQQAALLPPV